MKADDLIGKPFKLGGRGPEYWDCYGIIIELAKRLGYYIPDLGTPGDAKTRIAIMHKVSSEYTTPIEKPELYSIVVFDPKIVQSNIHVGMIYPDKRSFIHAGGVIPSNRSVRVNRLDTWPWKSRIYGYFRLMKKL